MCVRSSAPLAAGFGRRVVLRRCPAGLGALLWSLASCGGSPDPPRVVPTGEWLSSVGFQARAEWSSTVLHVDREDTHDSLGVGYFLAQLPDLSIDRPNGEAWGISRQIRDGGPMCEMSVLINGVWAERIDVLGSRLDVEDLVSPRDLDGLEIHFGSDGPLYDATGCGSILVWTNARTIPGEARFEGRVLVEVHGEASDTVVAVRLDPQGIQVQLDGAGSGLFSVLPGSYALVFLTPSGPIARRSVRVYAYDDSIVRLELGQATRGPRHRIAGRWTRRSSLLPGCRISHQS